MKIALVVSSRARTDKESFISGNDLRHIIYVMFHLQRASFDVDILSLNTEPVPIDESTRNLSDPLVRDFLQRSDMNFKIKHPLQLSAHSPEDYNALVIVGGLTSLWEFPQCQELVEWLSFFLKENKLVATVAGGVSALLALPLETALPLPRVVTGLSNEEITALGYSKRVLYFPENELQKRGYQFCKKEIWQTHIQIDKNFISAQNTSSVHLMAEKLVDALFVLKNK